MTPPDRPRLIHVSDDASIRRFKPRSIASPNSAALASAGAEVRVLQDFWPGRDAVIASSLQFSIIQTANAQPRRG